MLSSFAVAMVIAATVSVGGREAKLLRGGGDPSRGILVNQTPGFRPFDPPVPGRPTVVFIHGLNPLPGVVHFVMTERVAEALSRRGGQAYNILGWNWNAATLESLRPGENIQAAIRQGQALAWSLRQWGVDPARTHLIGHSAGGIVATSAAREIARSMGTRAAQLTLLDPAAYYHSVLFDQLQAGSLAPVVENYWSPGPSAYGRQAARPGVRDLRVEGAASYAGVLCPLRSDHLGIVRWYLATIENPQCSWGFNTSRWIESAER
jgi:pimeloyl-ACP methyl ester carboxylesterase